jgi:hypothetical protein
MQKKFKACLDCKLRLSSFPSPPEIQENLSMALQGYFDDSGSHDQDPIFMVAGFVSTDEKWSYFSDKWQNKLNEEPTQRLLLFSGGERCR